MRTAAQIACISVDAGPEAIALTPRGHVDLARLGLERRGARWPLANPIAEPGERLQQILDCLEKLDEPE
jgi:hypothetical protein